MAETGGSVTWNLDVDNSKFKSGLSKASSDASAFGKHLDKTGLDAQSSFSNHLAGLANFAAVWAKRMVIAGGAAAAGFTVFGLKTAGDLEASRQGFITLLGSAKAADKVLAQIKADAKRTPFELKGLIQANQMLTAVTHNGQRSERLLLNVGKALAAMGKGQPELDRIIVNLQQIGAVGHASAIDLKQFAFAGIPIYEILKKNLGLSGEELERFTSEGKLSFELFEKAFQTAGEGSGQFSKAFINQAGTFNQLISNMKDSVAIFASDFVKSTGIFGVAKNAIAGFTAAITNNRETIVNATVTAFTFMRNIISQIATVVSTVARFLINVLGPSISALVNTIVTSLLPTFKRLYDSLQPALIKVLKFVAIALGVTIVAALFIAVNALNILIKVFSFVVTSIARVIAWAGNLAGAIKNMASVIIKATSGFGSLLYDAGKSLIQGLVNGIKDSIGRVLGAVGDVIGGAVNKAKSLLHIRSPSKVFADIGKNVGLGLAQGINSSRINVQGAIGNLTGGLGIDGTMNLTPSVGAVGGSGGVSNNSNVVVNLHMNGVMTRSRADLRDISKDMVRSVNEELRAKGVAEIGGGAI